jgi:Phycobilisome protein
MNPPLSSIFRQSDGRYLTADERDQVLAYARDLPARVQAAQAVEAAERGLIDAVVGELRERYPRFERLFPNAWDRLAGDLRLVLRADTRAMLAGDLRVLEDKALFYLRSILAAYNVTPQFARDAFTLLRDQCRGRLAAEAFARLDPFLERNVQVLADFPEPAVAMV